MVQLLTNGATEHGDLNGLSLKMVSSIFALDSIVI